VTEEPTLPDAPDSLLARVSRMTFSPAERRIVEYLLSVAEFEIAGLTSAELAERTGTSRSSIDRLAKRLDYSGLREMRRALLRESRSMHTPVSQAAAAAREPAIVPSDGMAEIAYKVFHNAAIRAMKFAEILSRSPELEALVARLEAAPNVQVFGAGASAVVARDMHQRLLRLGVRINAAEDHHQQIAFASLMQPGDLAVAVSYSGRTRPVLQAARIANERGAAVAAVLGVGASPLGELADIRIVTPPGVSLFGTDAVMTRILEMMFNEVLFHCLALRDPRLRENVDRIEALLDSERL